MGQQVCMSGLMQCSFGVSPASLIVPPDKRVNTMNLPAATIMHYIPISNIPTFGMCSSLANPTVASATAAASGVLTPMPCVPATTAPWVPGSPTVLIGSIPALNNSSKCMCSYGGVISINFAGQATVNIP